MATNFEGYSHKELLAMLASVDGEKVKTRGQLLKDAEIEITKIGNDLKNHKVENWEGQAAEAFQNWVNRLGNSTLRLGEYSKTGGEWMVNAAQTIVEVKANMPAYDQGAYDNLEASREARNDPDAQKIGMTAHSKLAGDRLEAVQQMNKLAQSYEASTTQMNAAPIPTFPPAPPEVVPTNIDGAQEISRSGGDPALRNGLREANYAPPSGDTRGPSSEPGWVPGHQPKNPDPTTPSTVPPVPDRGPGSPTLPPVPDRDVNTDLDSVKTLPPQTTTPVIPVAPSPGPGAPPTGPVPPVMLPPVGGPPTHGPGPGRQVPGIPGIPGIPGAPGPGSPPVSKLVGPNALPPRDSGIHGGRQVNTTGPTSGLHRGTVIGEGGTGQAGRGAYGPGMGGGGFGGGAQGGSVPGAGRRLASEPGGIVGGRPAGGATGATAGARPFTQGGAGLVRGNQTPGRRPERENGERPDYLSEDEETWQGDRRVVPPVVD
ncbi:hypothetical protein [Streptomyces venezuelae]|uniref:hypothetical protein n=1 Tax=Streptomyces venezuelae TaxID=54571 RepID=UPI0016813BC5|nr:hypothetical protein [Streptomyces venezuelae]